MQRCPLKLFEEQILNKGIVTKDDIDDMKNKMDAELVDAVNYAKKSVFPTKDELSKDVFFG